MLPPLEAGDRALIHEVIPTAKREAGDAHLREMQAAVFFAPVIVVMRMAKPFFHEFAIVTRLPANFGQGLKSLGPSDAANAIAFVK